MSEVIALNNKTERKVLFDNFSQHLNDAETLAFARINQPQYHQKSSQFCVFHKMVDSLYAEVFH
jgi:hypothetical protein